MKYTNIFTSESVGEGHPDKVADLISDSILDACLAQDPTSRVACETLVKDNHVVLAGEITTKAVIDYEKIVRDTIAEIGYRTAADDALFNAENVDITNYLSTQSPDIAQGVDACEAEGKEGAEQGAGDQGIMFGYASNETPELMPAPIMFSHRIMMELAKVRHSGVVTWLRPDSKSQVAVEYGDNGRPARILNVVLSTQHTEDVDIATIREFCSNLIRRCLPADLITPETEFFINPTGRFVIGGPHGDSGLTGRKIIVDTYGGMARHGGGAFSGKDPSKVDRSAAYAGRYVAKNIVAAGLAERCEIQVSYAIGVAEPTSISLNTFGTGKISDEQIIKLVRDNFDLRPYAINKMLDLLHPMYEATAAYGHFGRNPYEMTVGTDTFTAFPWEKVDRAEALRASAGL